MENSNFKGRILMEMNDLIAQSSPEQKKSLEFQKLHEAIVRNHYNAADLSIDYHRRRVEMDVVVDDQQYDPKTINVYLPTLHVNLWYRNLTGFLKSCIDYDPRSIALYARLLKMYTNKKKPTYTI